MVITDARLAKLPKVELHVHLDGSVKPQTVLELAREQGVALPADTAEGLVSYMQVSDDCGSLTEYLSKFQFVLRFMQRAEAIERIAYELVEQAAQEEVMYIEVRFGPHLHTGEGLTADEAIAAALRGLARGEAHFGVIARLIVIAMRHEQDEVNRPVLEAALRYRDHGVAAVDLAGDEAGFPAQLFRSLFVTAQEAGLPITIHAGEAAGAANIEEAVVHLGASRLGHGVRLQENADVFALVQQRRIPLEMCPVSNMQTKAVSGWSAYPIGDYIRQGLAVTVNTDNRTVSDTTLTKEYAMLMAHCGLSIEQIAQTILTGIDAAFVDEAVKAGFRKKLRLACEELKIAL